MGEALGGLKRSHFCGNLREEQIGESVTLMGWVQKSRNLGSIVFADLRDYTGIVQVVFDGDTDEAIFEKATKLRSEFCVAVVGAVRMRSQRRRRCFRRLALKIPYPGLEKAPQSVDFTHPFSGI